MLLPACVLAAILASESARAASASWLGTTGNWSASGTWSGGTPASGAGFTASFTGVDITANRTVTVDAARTIGHITFTDEVSASHNLTLAGSSVLTLDENTGAPLVNVTQAGRTLTISCPVSGNNGLTKTGPGSLTLSGNSTLTGVISAAGGNLRFNSAASLGNPSSVAINGGTVVLGSTAAFSGSVPLTLVSRTGRLETSGQGGNLTYQLNGTASGGGSLHLLAKATGSETFDLGWSSAATYSGGTRIENDSNGSVMVRLGSQTSLPATTVLNLVSDGIGSGRWAVLDLNGRNQILAGLENEGTGTETLRNWGVINSSATAATLTFNNTSDLEYSGNLGDGGVYGSGTNFQVVKTGSATQTLSGIGSYTGNTTVNAGTLVIGYGGQLRFAIGNNGVTNRLDGTGNVILDGSIYLDLTTADATFGNSWQIVNTSSLSAQYGGFSLVSSLGGFFESGGVWTLLEPERIWTFSEATGILSVAENTGGVTNPTTFTRAISTGSGFLTVNFTLHPVRNANFEVFVQQANGSYLTHAADIPRTYLGTVDELPGAVACGFLSVDGTLSVRIALDDGNTWTSTGGVAVWSGSDIVPEWPTTVMPAGGAGSSVFAAEVGIDSSYNHFAACGSDVATAVERIEYSVLSTNMIYLRDAAITHRIGKIVIRADAAQDPYSADGGDTTLLLAKVKAQWNAASPMGSSHDVACVVHSTAGGGLASVGAIGTSSRYSSNDSDATGDFFQIWRHEVGHNWGSGHYEGGGKPEGTTIMSGNGHSRFSSSELLKMVNHRNSRTVLDALGTYPFLLPPRANQDTGTYFRESTTAPIDVLANDSDSNGDSLSLLSFDATSALGGIVSRSVGTGPGGRDEILYTPPPGLTTGTDWFTYRIQDSTGMQAVGYVMTRPKSEDLVLLDHWKLDDSGTTAINMVRATRDGTLQNGVLTGQGGAASVTRNAFVFDGIDDRVSIPAPNYFASTISFTAWVKRNGTQALGAPVLFSRTSLTVAGLQFGSSNELHYTWIGAGADWSPSPALTVPDGEWCLVALSVSPAGVTIHLRTASGLQSATHVTPITFEFFNSTTYLGWDSGSTSRHFKGALDDVRVYGNTLDAAEIESLYQEAVLAPAVTLTSPIAASVSPLNVSFSATVNPLTHIVDKVDFVENGNIAGTTAIAPYQATVALTETGPHTFIASASYGNWAYQADSPPVSFQAFETGSYELWVDGQGLAGDDALRTADPDDDGLDNLMEFGFDFNPADPNSRLKMTLSGASVLTINKVIPAGTFTLQWNDLLTGPWTGSMVIPVLSEASDFQINAPTGDERRFYRLRYESP